MGKKRKTKKKRIRPKSRKHLRKPPHVVPTWKRMVENAPLFAMYLFGTMIMYSFGWLFALTYIVLVIFSLLWHMRFICSHCLAPKVNKCVSGIGNVAYYLYGPRDHKVFPRNFKRHVGINTLPWFIPPFAAGYSLYLNFSIYMLVILILFCIAGFILVPLTSNKHGCGDCPMKKVCPYAKTQH